MMDYIIFLKSGETLSGTMDETEVSNFIMAYRNKTPGVLKFTDTEGFFLLEMENVAAIGFNQPGKSIPAGFMTETP